MDNLNRRVIRGYQIGEQVSADNFSVLYKAYQAAIERDVVLRVILPQFSNQPEFIRRFEVDAQLIARLEHPHILPLYDYWREPEGAYLAMRWLPGSLRSAIQRGPWSLEAAARVLEQIAEALAVAHREGILHRRLTPASILLDEDENAYLTDFGIAEPAASAAGETTAALPIQMAYAAPEQTQGETLTPRTDIYRLGLIMYELLTGALPSPTDNSAEDLTLGHPNRPLPPLDLQRPALPAAINEVLQTATAADALQRYATALRFSAAFRAAIPIVQRTAPQPLADPLTERELDILRLMLADLSNPQIAQTLYLTSGTVKWYVQQLYRKLDVHSRRQALDRARQLKLVEIVVAASQSAALPQLELTRRAQGEAEPIPKVVNPYKGLRAFQEADAADFFGRAALTEKLLGRLLETDDGARFLAVVGPSGSGKSSVVRAGLIPALRRGALRNSERWFITDMLPGTQPLEELEAALLRVAVGPLPGLLSQLSEDRRGLVRAARRVLPSDQDVELLLFIDQFEELFSLVANENIRQHFIDNLLAAVADPRCRIRILLTLRADFYDRPLMYPRLAELMRSHTEVVVPLTSAEMERAIAGPAEEDGLTLEPGLVAAIVRDVEAQPGGLPLMQYALTELFERREGLTLRRAIYQASGGLSGALARRAEELYGELQADGQAATRQVFLRLVRLGQTTEDTRRRVRLADLESGVSEPRVLDEVLTAFDHYRLLTFDRDPVTREPTVELAHEALIHAWQRLSDWIAVSGEDMRTQQTLSAAAREWVVARRDLGLLAAGTRLAQFEALASGSSLRLNSEEQAYVDASIVERSRREKESQIQEHRLVLLRRAIVGVLVTSLAIAVGLLLFAFESRNAALAQAQVAFSRQLAVEAIDELQNPVGNDEAAALFAIRSLNFQYNAEADAALVEAASRLPLRQFSGHSDEVYSAVFSPDGRYVATASADHTAKIWEAATGKELFTLMGHTDEVVCIAFSPDDQYVLTGSSDHTAKLWDAATGREVRTFDSQTDEVHSVAFSPDGQYILTGNYDGTATLWKAATGQIVQVYKGHTDSIKSVAFSPDGSQVLTGSSDRTAKLWDTASGRQLRTFTGHIDAVYSVAFSPDGRSIVTGSADNTAKLWEARTGKIITTFAGHSGSARSVVFSADGQTILTASGDTTVKLWQVATGQVVRTFRGHTDKVSTAVFSPDGQFILTSSVDHTAKLWPISDNPVGVIYRGHTGGVYGVAFSPDGHYVATSGEDYTARLWETATGQPIRTFIGHTNHVISLAFSPDGRSLLTGSFDHTAKLWDVASGRLIWTLAGHTDQVLGVAFSPDGRSVLTGGLDHTARLWNTTTGELLHTFVGHTDTVWDVAFSPNGRYLLTSSIDKSMRLWDAATYQELGVWNANHEFLGLAFSPDSHFILATASGQTAQLWDVAKGQPVRTLVGHTNTIYHVAFSPDGQYGLTSSEDRTAKIWDLATGNEIRTLSGHTGAVWGVAFSPDGRSVLTGSLDGTARLWDADYHDLIGAVCRRLLRDFTDNERNAIHLEDQKPTCPPVSSP